MDKQDLRTLKFLEEIERNHTPSQRELASKLDISLGLANSFIKRLSQKGYFKVTNIPKNRIKYILTPKGFAEKSRLTFEYIRYSYHFYKEARSKLKNLFQEFIDNDINRVVFYGVSDFAEIAFLSLQETPIKLVAVMDNHNKGLKFLNQVVQDQNVLSTILFDRILITAERSSQDIQKKILAEGVSMEKIVALM